MPKMDLFDALDALFTKAPMTDPPPPFLMHRFLASDPDFAVAAKYLQKDLSDPAMVIETWRGLLRRGRGAPRLHYVAPKKGPAADELTERMMKDLPERREVVERIQDLAELGGWLLDLYLYHGVEPPDELKPRTLAGEEW